MTFQQKRRRRQQQKKKESFWDTIDDPLFGFDDTVQPMPPFLDGTLWKEPAQPFLYASSSSVDTRQKKRARLLAASTADGVADATQQQKPVRKTIRVPQVLSARDTLAAKYPQEMKQAIATCLKGKLDLDIHEQIRGAVRRPGLIGLSSYWFYAWQFVRCYVSMWPLICLPRCDALFKQLQAAQRIFMQQFPQIMHEPAIEQQRREQFRRVTSSASQAAPPVTKAAASGAAVTSSTTTTRSMAVANKTSLASTGGSLTNRSTTAASVAARDTRDIDTVARALFVKCCAAARTEFTIDNNIKTLVQDEAAAQEETLQSSTKTKEKTTRVSSSESSSAERKRAQVTAYRQTMFECFAMFILAVAERGGDIYLKRSSVNAYIVELLRVKDEFDRRAAVEGLIYNADDVAIGRRFDSLLEQQPSSMETNIRLAQTISHNDVRVAHRQISTIFELVKKEDDGE